MKWEAPIVKETRTIRENLVKKAGGFEAYVKKLQQKELKHKKRMLRKEQLQENMLKAS